MAEVDLTTFSVRSHPLRPLARTADAAAGPRRDALWLGRETLAVTGTDSHRPEAHGSGRTTPAGLTLVDTRRWYARTIDPRTTDAALFSGTVLATSFRFDFRRQTAPGSGLTGYSIDGRRKFDLFGEAPIVGVQPVGARALVGAENGITLIDARTRRRLRSYRRFAMSLLAGDAPFH